MGSYLLRRLLQMLAALLGVSLVVFFTLRLSGDVVSLYLPMEAPLEQREEMRQLLGLDQPLAIQYVRFLGDLMQGNFGVSLRFSRPPLDLVFERLPNTLLLAVTGLIIGAVLGGGLGILAAVRQGSRLDLAAISFAVLGQSIPGFWFGLMLIIFFAVNLRWLPTSGMGDWRNLILPSLTLATTVLPQTLQFTRSSLLEALQENYVMVARAKGLPEVRVLLRHALKNSLNPVVTMLGLQLGTLMGGSVITETVFAWPGIGQLAVQAIFNRDMPIVQAAVFVMATGIMVTNLIVDLLNTLLDPRIRHA